MNKAIKIFGVIIIFLVLCTNFSYAQKNEVLWDKDTVKADGKPYFIMKKKKSGPMRYDFIVTALTGTELLYFKSMLRPWVGNGFRFGQNDELIYELNFMATGSKANVTQYIGNGFNIGNNFAKLVAENNLIKEYSIDSESESRFIQLHDGSSPSSSNSETTNTTPAVIVNINNNNGASGENNSAATTTIPKSSSPIIITGKQIIRDSVVIGKFRQDTTSSSYSQRAIKIIIYTEAGEKVAEASTDVTNPQEWSIKILNENKTYNILYESPNERENLFKWLADKKYIAN